MVNEMLSHDAFKLTGDTKSDLEKVYIQQYIHYIMSPLDQFINVRRSGIPMKNSTFIGLFNINSETFQSKRTCSYRSDA